MVRLKFLASVLLVGLTFFSFNNRSPEPVVGVEIGNKVPNIETSLLNGEEFNLESLKGKMVLLDFWASYDGLSRIDNHEKMLMQSKFANSKFYRGEGFVIVSISLDQFNSPLQKAIKEDGYVKALHICDFKGDESDIASAYSVHAPTNILIDGEGRLISKSTSISEVHSALEYLYAYSN
ncbi:TlpA family protein disulfide reductase [Saccharicrinis aurantiacus]|uniref:TlpA family protein disulfide reductase n=1 Tax=Saccharicrinis aurantiacus TaxID=1849719 RepID=UPI000838B72D|nr:TlpA disulfide reductase family protein [Saccharicrinis aurantiacus]